MLTLLLLLLLVLLLLLLLHLMMLLPHLLLHLPVPSTSSLLKCPSWENPSLQAASRSGMWLLEIMSIWTKVRSVVYMCIHISLSLSHTHTHTHTHTLTSPL